MTDISFMMDSYKREILSVKKEAVINEINDVRICESIFQGSVRGSADSGTAGISGPGEEYFHGQTERKGL